MAIIPFLSSKRSFSKHQKEKEKNGVNVNVNVNVSNMTNVMAKLNTSTTHRTFSSSASFSSKPQQRQPLTTAKPHCPVPYQVDYTNAFVGKRVNHTKRRVRFIFGFASLDAVRSGFTGSACRGDEHEVVLVLSWASGKQCVTLDGKEIYRNVDRSASNGTFVLCFNVGQHVCILKGSIGILSGVGFAMASKSFDLTVDGKSYFRMTKIYELGNFVDELSNNSSGNLSGHRLHKALQHHKDNNSNAPQASLVLGPLSAGVNGYFNRSTAPAPIFPARPRINTLPDKIPAQNNTHQNNNSNKNNDTDLPSSPQNQPHHRRSFSQPVVATDPLPGTPPAHEMPDTVEFGDAHTYRTPDDKRKTRVAGMVEEAWEILGSFKDDGTVTSTQTTNTNVVYPDYFDYYNDYVKKTGGETPPSPPPTIRVDRSLDQLKLANNNKKNADGNVPQYDSPNRKNRCTPSPALTAYPIYDDGQRHGEELVVYRSPSAATSMVNSGPIGSFPTTRPTSAPRGTNYYMA